MACFDDIISLEELCDSPTPTSGFYLNRIGINKTEIEQIITNDYSNIQDFIDKKSAFAVDKVTGEIYTHLSPMFKADSILAGGRVGYEATTKELISQTGYVGLEVKIYNPGSYIDFTISDISLFVDSTTTVPVLIYDLNQGKLLGTINVSTTAGQISTSYEKFTVSAPRNQVNLWLGYDATAIDSYKTTTINGCTDCHGYTFSQRYVSATGATSSGSPFTAATITSLTHTAGISFNYSVTCNHKDWLCNNRAILGLPILYKTGIEMMNHALLSAPNQRTNTTTMVNTDLLEKKLAYFTHEYDKLMSDIMNNMRVPQDKNCFECNRRVQTKTILP